MNQENNGPNYGEKIRVLIDTLHITQAEFAEAVGADQGNISNYISGKKRPCKALVNSIINTYGVNRAWFEEGIGPVFSCDTPPSKEAEKLENRRISLIEQVHSMSEHQLQALMAFNDFYARWGK